MSTERIPTGFDNPIIDEKGYLDEVLTAGEEFPEVACFDLTVSSIQNPCLQKKIGRYRNELNRKSVTANMEVINKCIEEKKTVPSFLEAGPRKILFHNPKNLKVAIVTTGGLAPGLNCVVHSIVKRHCATYEITKSKQFGVYGINESFKGACDLHAHLVVLTPSRTEAWLEKGGSGLGMRRHFPDGNDSLTVKQQKLTAEIAAQIIAAKINILYVIGGDGSLSTAHQIALKVFNKNISVIGIPKTMDNDVFWVSESFGFKTAVENTTHIINTLNSEAESTRRICLIEIFGAESGFVAAHSALASGHVDLVLVPEEFQNLTKTQCEGVLTTHIEYLKEKVGNLPTEEEKPHAVVVIAEGVAKILKEKKARLGGKQIGTKTNPDFLIQLKDYLNNTDKGYSNITDRDGNKLDVFFNRPRHYIRATPANSHDQVYCDQLGAMAVDSALAGFTDCMISLWHNNYVLVPLELVADKHRRISPDGVFWKQVVNNTNQPTFESNREAGAEI